MRLMADVIATEGPSEVFDDPDLEAVLKTAPYQALCEAHGR